MNVDDWDGDGPLPKLYAKTASGGVNEWSCWVDAEYVRVQWGQVGGQLQHASFACEPKNVGRSNETSAHQQAIKEAIAKWKKQLKKKYYLSADEALTSLNLKPMLAKSFEDRKDKVTYPVYVQPKFDGVRCLAYRIDGQVVLQSRGGDPYSVEHIQRQLTPYNLGENVVLDGELYHHGTSLQTITSWVKKPQDDSVRLTYVVYDIAARDVYYGNWSYRLQCLNSLFSNVQFDNIFLSPGSFASSEEEVRELHKAYVAEGYEGVIVRLMEGEYRFAYRSSELLKLKSFQDAEFPIVGWSVGKGKFENVPIFRCVTGEGKEFDVAPKGTDAERAKMLRDAPKLVGKQLTVKFFDWTDDRVPHFPVGLGIREPGT